MNQSPDDIDPPAPGNPTATSLLAAGRDLFARRGYDGTSVRAITSEAGANLGAVTYHFGSKRALYEEVLERATAPLRLRVADATGGAGPVLDRVAAVVRTFFDHLAENPDLPRLLLQEISAGKDPPPPIERTFRPILGALVALVTEGQRSGEVRDGDPRLLALSCVAQPIHLSLVNHWVRRLADLHLEDADERSRIVEHAVRFALAGLAAGASTPEAQEKNG